MAQFTHYRVYGDRQIPEIGSELVREDQRGFIEKLSEKLQIIITSLDEESIEFDLVGIDSSIANALRRILLAEVCYFSLRFTSAFVLIFCIMQVPTIAVEHVWIAINSSIIQDEVLAHRIGLVPIRADPSKLEYVVGEEETDRDTVVFHFDIECKNETITKPNGQTGFVNESALSGALNWLPQGSQAEVFPGI
jgi:DNA-directed RNA polymerase I and III subunit RPAC1